MGGALLNVNSGTMLLIVFAILIINLFMGSPVSTCMGITAIICMLLFMGPKFLQNFASVAYARGIEESNIVVPMFILMAEFFSHGGIASDLFHVMSKLLSKIKGGLAIATTLTCTVFAALCGSSPATAATIGRVASGEMIKRGYSKDFTIGCIAGGGTLGIMIPPSITFVMFAILTETSVVKLLMAGVLPGLMLSLLMCLSVPLRVAYDPSLIGEDRPSKILNGQKRYEKRKALIAAGKIEAPVVVEQEERQTNILQDLKMCIPAFILILIVLGSIYTGAATATEASAVGAISALLITVCQRRLSKADFLNAIMSACRTASMMIIMLIGGFCLTQVVSRCGVADKIAVWIVNSGVNRYVIMVLLYILWYFLGCLIDPTSMVVMTIPFVFPSLVKLGFDPLWIGVVSTLCVEVGMITPPVGINLFILRSSTDFDIKSIMRGAIPYVIILTIGLVILNIFPQIALFIPSHM